MGSLDRFRYQQKQYAVKLDIKLKELLASGMDQATALEQATAHAKAWSSELGKGRRTGTNKGRPIKVKGNV